MGRYNSSYYTWVARYNDSMLATLNGYSKLGILDKLYSQLEKLTVWQYSSGKLTRLKLAGKTKSIDQNFYYSYSSTVSNIIKPMAVTVSASNVSETSIKVKWSKTNAENASYKLYKKVGDGDYSYVKTIDGLSYTDPNLTPGEKYTYKVIARREIAEELYINGKASNEYEMVAMETNPTFTDPELSSEANTDGNGNVNLTFNSSESGAMLQIYRSEDHLNWSRIKTVSNATTS